MGQSIIKYILSDNVSLSAYLNGARPNFDSVKRSLFQLLRTENRGVPDHHYRTILRRDLSINNEINEEGISNIGTLLRTGLFSTAHEHLELNSSVVKVKSAKQNSWQELITFIPPLVLTSVFLQCSLPLQANNKKYLREYFQRFVVPNSRYTALPSPYIPQLQTLLNKSNGFHDLHIHLNGSTETDVIWQEYLREPDRVYYELKKAYDTHNEVKEHLLQESAFLNPRMFKDLLVIARRLRWLIFEQIFHRNEPSKGSSNNLKLQKIIDIYSRRGTSSITHPIAFYFGFKSEENDMSCEALLYVLAFQRIAENPRHDLANTFHFYLLILGLCNRFLVQQTHQYGFEQFQKHTLIGLREYSERRYSKRFYQMQGNSSQYLKFIEGRFSPKATREQNVKMLRAIDEGWRKMGVDIKNVLGHSERTPSLKLTAHFIKRKDDNKHDFIRHYNLRKLVHKQAIVLGLLIKEKNSYKRILAGIDAAASEFDAPPEVFAPTFRLLRKKEFRHFTYHAGEDFYHIIGGLRAIFEAVTFCELKNGDRIGHATATGLSAELWKRSMGPKILINRGMWLDDLLFSYHLIISNGIGALTNKLPLLANQIEEHATKVYGEKIATTVLLDSWLLRKHCPIHARFQNIGEARRHPNYEDILWLDLPKTRSNKAWELLFIYHSKAIRKRYDEIISIDVLSPFDLTEIELLQKSMLEFMHSREIVIETLPTSNVRIGYYKDYSGYHLWNWIDWAHNGHKVPPIVLGTDDTGIFATNIFNEYSNIYCFLTERGRLSHDRAMSFIKQLEENADIYKFV